MAETFETVKLNFNGGIATHGRIHLYEYSRSQYALSRFITTIEHYRRYGEIADRITRDRTIDMIVSAPERGSFDLSVLVPIATAVVPELAGTSFKALFSYVWTKLLPPNESKAELAVKLAQIELDRSKELTVQSLSRDHEETERLRVFQSIVERQSATTEQFITLLQRAIDSPTQKHLNLGYGLTDLAREEELAKADLEREQNVEENFQRLSRIDSTDIAKLTNKLRPMVSEIALPLRRSAERCYIGDADNDDAYIRMDEERSLRSRRALSIQSQLLSEGYSEATTATHIEEKLNLLSLRKLCISPSNWKIEKS